MGLSEWECVEEKSAVEKIKNSEVNYQFYGQEGAGGYQIREH